jgi:hypothetical protein
MIKNRYNIWILLKSFCGFENIDTFSALQKPALILEDCDWKFAHTAFKQASNEKINISLLQYKSGICLSASMSLLICFVGFIFW